MKGPYALKIRAQLYAASILILKWKSNIQYSIFNIQYSIFNIQYSTNHFAQNGTFSRVFRGATGEREGYELMDGDIAIRGCQ